MKRSIVCLAVLLPALALASPATSAFGGKVLVSDTTFPTGGRAENASVAMLKKHARARIPRSDDGTWHIYFAAFFKRPVNDKVVHLKLYDLTRKLVVRNVEQYVDDRRQHSFVSMLTIKPEAGDMRDGARLELEVSADNRVLATGTFSLEEAQGAVGSGD
jgi:hypothetical protein